MHLRALIRQRQAVHPAEGLTLPALLPLEPGPSRIKSAKSSLETES